MKISDLSMNEPTFRGIIGKYRSIVLSAEDVEDVFDMVYDILEAEADALRIAEPWATVTIGEYEKAATVINSLRSDVGYAYEEVFK